MTVRVLIWNLFDSSTTIDELRDALPELAEPSVWIWSDGSERFAVIAYGDELTAELARTRELVGRDPDVAEEFDVLDL